jgi:OOP family OmpA-OmpF porin
LAPAGVDGVPAIETTFTRRIARMWNWQKWIWPGVLATVMLTALAILMKSGSIQEDLQTRCLQGNDWAVASADGRDMHLTGTAPSEEARDTAIASVRECYGVRTASADITLLPVEVPFTFSARRTDGGVVLDGFVPDEATRSRLLDAARGLEAGEVVDNLQLARGAQSGFGDLAGFGIEQLRHLKAGSASLTGENLSVSGMAATPSSRDSLNAALSGVIPGNGRIETANIEPPVIEPYVWSFSVHEGTAPILSGYVPEDAVSQASRDEALAALGSAIELDNTLEVADGAPEGFSEAVLLGVRSAGRLADGKASIEATTLTVEGKALSALAARQIEQDLKNGLPANYSGIAKIDLLKPESLPVLAPDTCQEAMTTELKSNTIRFETNEAAIERVSYGMLDRLAFAVKRCPTATVEISGHTDSDGSDAYNQELSERRANAVRSYLVSSGVFAGRLNAAGYGETRPVGDNATDAGKAMNRRIEFKVIQ